jgi:hypothetical protein
MLCPSFEHSHVQLNSPALGPRICSQTESMQQNSSIDKALRSTPSLFHTHLEQASETLPTTADPDQLRELEPIVCQVLASLGFLTVHKEQGKPPRIDEQELETLRARLRSL